LIDAHAHVQSERGLRDALRFGVTTDLDMLTDVTFAQTHRGQRDGLLRTDRCDLWSAGAPVTSPGGMGTQFGFGFPTVPASEQAADFVDARLREGSDYIKIMYEPDAGIVTTISDATMAAAVVEAHAQGVLALVHVTTLVGARAAVDAHVDGLAHVFGDAPVDDALLAKMKAQHTFVTGTLMAFAFLGGRGRGLGPELAADPRIAPYLTAKQKVELARPGMPSDSPMGKYLDRFKLATASANLQRMRDAGVVVLAGDDGANFGSSGVSMHGELTLLVRAGFTPAQALHAATLATANAFHLDDRGRVAKGARADLILVDGNPLVDISATRAIVKVWKNGYDVPRTLR
jgi:imidazolonepropionase-like amidohydrolase